MREAEGIVREPHLVPRERWQIVRGDLGCGERWGLLERKRGRGKRRKATAEGGKAGEEKGKMGGRQETDGGSFLLSADYLLCPDFLE